MTIPPEREAQILRYYHVEKWRAGTIARQLGVHHGVVNRVLGQAGLAATMSRRHSKADPYLPFILATLEKFPALTAARLYAMVQERGIAAAPAISARLSPITGRAQRLKPICAFGPFPASRPKLTGPILATSRLAGRGGR